MIHFTEWLSQTSFSIAIATHDWVIPTVQSIHIVAIGIILASVFMIDLRVLGWAGRDQTLTETTARFGPWLSGALCVLLVTGGLMVVGEPARELLAFSFWFKMCLVAIGTAIATVFQITLKQNEARRKLARRRRSIKSSRADATDLGVRGDPGTLIAYDHVWGSGLCRQSVNERRRPSRSLEASSRRQHSRSLPLPAHQSFHVLGFTMVSARLRCDLRLLGIINSPTFHPHRVRCPEMDCWRSPDSRRRADIHHQRRRLLSHAISVKMVFLAVGSTCWYFS